MITIEQVQCWYVTGGIGHAVGRVDDGFITVGCGLFSGNSENTTAERPKRICAKCREALKKARLTEA